MLNTLVEELTHLLKVPLPGIAAQKLMSPIPLNLKRFQFDKLAMSRKGSVLILLYPHKEEIFFPLTLRATYQGAHSAQVSLPGGSIEESDDSLMHTALRETEEEIGVQQDHIKIIGALSKLYIPVSDFVVTPYVAYIDLSPSFVPDPIEVAQIIPTALNTLIAHTDIPQKRIFINNEKSIYAPYFDIHGHTVWGATAMILSEFVTILRKIS